MPYNLNEGPRLPSVHFDNHDTKPDHTPPTPTLSPQTKDLSTIDPLNEFLPEAQWYEDLQRAFCATVREGILETEREIAIAHRELNVSERMLRDGRTILRRVQKEGNIWSDVEGMRTQLANERANVVEIEGRIRGLE